MNGYCRSLVIASLALSAGCVATPSAEPIDERRVAKAEQAASQAQVNVFHSSFNAGEAYTWFWSDYIGGGIDAYESKSGNNRTTGLMVNLYGVDPTSQQCQTETVCTDPNDPATCQPWQWCYYTRSTFVVGGGAIPIRDFSVGKYTAELHTDLSRITNFDGYAGTCDQNGCVASPPTGKIDLSWTANGLQSSTFNGVNSNTSTVGGATYTLRTTGNYTGESADIDGTVLGNDVTAGNSLINQSKGTSVSKDILHN